MKNRTGLIVLVILQVAALLVTWAVGSGHGARQTIDVPLAASTLYSLLETDRLHMPLAWSHLTSFDVEVDESVLRRGSVAYLWLEKENSRWQPVRLRRTRPGEGQPFVVARVKRFEPLQRYTVQYERAGQIVEGSYVGRVRGNPAAGSEVLVTVEDGRVVFITEKKTFTNKVYGRVLSVRRSPAGKYAYELKLSFPAGNREVTGTYTWNFYDRKSLPEPGQVVNLSWVRKGGRYKITYVDLNPYWPGRVTAVEEGWRVDLDLGLRDLTLEPGTIASLREIADTQGRLSLTLRAELTPGGQMRPLALLAGEQEIRLAE